MTLIGNLVEAPPSLHEADSISSSIFLLSVFDRKLQQCHVLFFNERTGSVELVSGFLCTFLVLNFSTLFSPTRAIAIFFLRSNTLTGGNRKDHNIPYAVLIRFLFISFLFQSIDFSFKSKTPK